MSVHIPADARTFLEGIQADSNMKFDREIRDEMLIELYDRFAVFVNGEYKIYMSAKDAEIVTTMYNRGKLASEIEKYAIEHVRNAGQIRAASFAKFRKLYFGKGS